MFCSDIQIPAHLDSFGWCTWDAFYTEVSPKGIIEGLQRFVYITADVQTFHVINLPGKINLILVMQFL